MSRRERDRLAEDDVGDALLLREADECIGDVLVIERDDLCAEVLGHATVLFDALKGFRISVAFVFVGAIDVDGVPIGSEAAGDACTDADQALGSWAGAEADHHLVGDGSLFQALSAAVVGGALADLLGGGAQSEFAEQVEISFAEKVGQRLLHLFRRRRSCLRGGVSGVLQLSGRR